jgi:hypothetical protein
MPNSPRFSLCANASGTLRQSNATNKRARFIFISKTLHAATAELLVKSRTALIVGFI